METAPLTAISPIDGRYHPKTEPLQQYFSEFALIKYRLYVEIQWLIYMCNEIKLTGTHLLTEDQLTALADIHSYFDVSEAQKVKDIEKTTNHDVKAVEYYLKEKLTAAGLTDLEEFVHFGCTSEDINNTAYGLMLKHATEQVILPELEAILTLLEENGKTHKKLAMLSRTHGQPASPTTLGKEFINYAVRLRHCLDDIKGHKYMAKFNGATGNYNAHQVTDDSVNWIDVSRQFLESLELEANLWTTQIEPHDYVSRYFANVRRANTVLLDFATDIWQYISINYFKQQLKKGEVGSSTMPHKVNPIDFENAEGNFELASGIAQFLEQKLMISRLQRDLSDSTVQRNLGIMLGYSLIAYKSLQKGIGKLEVNQDAIAADLEAHWVVVAEAIQTIMRRHHVEKPYEKLKELTRGKDIGAQAFADFIEKLDVPKAAKNKMAKINPGNYIGLATELVDLYFKQN